MSHEYELKKMNIRRVFEQVGKALDNPQDAKKKLDLYGTDGADGVSGEEFATDTIMRVKRLGNMLGVQWDGITE